MANELTISVDLSFEKDRLAVQRKVNKLRVDVAGDAYSAQVQSIPTTSGGTVGYAFFRNLDDTNYVGLGVQDGSTNFIAYARHDPGQSALGRLSTSTGDAQANTGAVPLGVVVIEA